MTSNRRYSHSFENSPGHLTRSHKRVSPSNPAPREPWQPDWLMILMVGLFVLTLMIAWLVDIPALLR
ncbi:hypothetical protein GCM10027347_33380 [Larkinella harenae]